MTELKRAKDLTGQTFGSLTAEIPVSRTAFGAVMWKCQCQCGKTHLVSAGNLTHGNVKSCGCGRATREGKSDTAEYNAWAHMIRRCSSQSEQRAYYFDRGIRVCKQWKGKNGFQCFLKHIGNRPSSAYSLDRTNNDGNYEPGNVRWATRSQQMKNRQQMGCLASFPTETLIAELQRRIKTMTPEEKENLLDICIDTCSEFEKETGMKTHEIHALSQKDLSLKTGLTLKSIKKWVNAAKTSQELITK